MGVCKSKPSDSKPSNRWPLSKLPPFNVSTDLFLELGVPLLSRPTPTDLQDLWYEHDLDHNEVLDATELRQYMQAISSRWGDGSWGKAAAAGGTASASKPSHVLLGTGAEVTWEEARSALWGAPVYGIPSPVVLLLQRAFKAECSGDGTLTRAKASELARHLLAAAHVPKGDVAAVSKGLLDASSMRTGDVGGHHVTANDFVARVGPPYAELSPSHSAFAGLDDEPDDLPPIGSRIRSFAPVRKDTSVEILNCGEAIMSAMIHAVDGATTEIMMSWWEFCPDLPAIRGESLGSGAWDLGSGTLPALLKQKADKGVKVYVLLWNIVDILMPTAPMVEHAEKILGELHPNITVVSHPVINTWTHTHHQKFMVVDRQVAILGGLDFAFKRWDTPGHPLFDPKSAVHPGMDLFVNGVSYSENINQYFRDKRCDVVANRGEIAAKTWQDVSVWLRGDAAADVALNFIQRWNWARTNAFELFGDGLRNDMPEVPSKIRYLSRPNPHAKPVDDSTRRKMTPGGMASPAFLDKPCKVQIVRSLGKWSGGTSPAEISHYEAWISAIGKAKDYIYIEQQYFISNMGEEAAKNRVAEAILFRAQHAISTGKEFRVYIVIPTTVSVEAVTYFTRRTLLQDGDKRELCLMSRIDVLLKKAKVGTYWHGKSANSMMSVCTLFSADKSDSGRWDVDEVFVHSKVLVVDDRVAIVGSANINDRSFVGYSDSELGAIMWDDGNGSIRDFRLRLWRQFLGLPQEGNADDLIGEPASETAFGVWRDAAGENQTLLASVTKFSPRDSITCYSQFYRLKREYQALSPEGKTASLEDPERLEEMKGQLVRMPRNFLGDQKKISLMLKLVESFDWTKPQFL